MTVADKTNVRSTQSTFTIRPATMGDLNEAVELFNLCSINMTGKPSFRLVDVRNEWLLPAFDLNSATRLVFTPDQRLVGYMEVWDIEDPPVKNWVWGMVHPDYEAQGIATQLMNWAEAKVRQTAQTVQTDLRITMEAGVTNHYQPAIDMVTDRGMVPIRRFLTMVTELAAEPPRPMVPQGISIRSMRGLEELKAIVFAVEDAFQDHWGFLERPFEKEYERWLHFVKNDPEFDPKMWFLATAGDEIAGISLCKRKASEDPDMGWVNTLGVRRPWRRQGLALALLHHSFRAFYARGKDRAGLGVDASSLTGATRLYEKAGMRPIREFIVYEKEIKPGKDIVRRSLD